MGQVGGLQSNQQNYQQCFIGHSQGAAWRETFEQVCEEVLPNFDLKPWYADKHYQGSVPLRQKVVNMIATTRYGIYDLSYWRQNDHSPWIMPRNVLIELGMAIALNRPMLLLRHGKNRECSLTLPACLEGVAIGEFGDGKKLLKETLNARLPSLTQHTPKQDWLNRYCHFGGLECPYREVHPQAQQWGRQKIHIHVSDGANAAYIDCDDFRDMIEEDVLNRFSNLKFSYLDSLTCPQGCKFLLCSRCQEVRSSPFAIYRITPDTSADTFIAIGMSIALEKQFNYPITKILITDDKHNIPSLLEGYEIIVERNYTRIADRLNAILPELIEKTRQTTWKPQPLPFEVFLPTKEYSEPEETTSTEEHLENDTQAQSDEDSSLQQETERDRDIDQIARSLIGDDYWNKFTQRAREVLFLADEEARRWQCDYIGTEFLLLGLMREDEGIAAEVLANLGVGLDKVRATTEFIIGRGDHIVPSKIGLTPRARKVIELVVDEARRLNHDYVDTEHLLLGLVREGEGIAAGVLESLGVTLEKARTQTIQVLSNASVPVTIDIDQAQSEEIISLERETASERDIGQMGRKEIGSEFEKFTQQARKVLSLAQGEAQRFQRNYIGTECLLLGLIGEGEGVAVKVLADLGVELGKLRSAVEFIIGRGDSTILGEVGLTPRAKKGIELAVDEARRLNHDYIGTEHLLLGLVREGEGIAAGVLESLGVTLEKARTQTIQVLSNASAPATTDINKETARNKPVSIFISYAHEDKQYLDQLRKHLLPLQRQGLIEMWHDGDIVGMEWASEINRHLNAADLILLLVSADFVASDYCYSIEMQRAMERHERGEARVIPIILRPVPWRDAPFGVLQALPTDAKPIISWGNQDEAFFDVVQGIRRVIEAWQERQ